MAAVFVDVTLRGLGATKAKGIQCSEEALRSFAEAQACNPPSLYQEHNAGPSIIDGHS